MTLDEAKRRLDEIWDDLFTYHASSRAEGTSVDRGSSWAAGLSRPGVRACPAGRRGAVPEVACVSVGEASTTVEHHDGHPAGLALGDPEPGDAERERQPWRRGRDVRRALPRPQPDGEGHGGPKSARAIRGTETVTPLGV